MAATAVAESVILLCLSAVMVSRSINGEVPEEIMSTIDRINKKGHFLGVVVSNLYEMSPLIQSPSFAEDPDLPYLDVAGRRFHFGQVEEEKVIVVMTGLSMLNAGLSTQLLLTLFKIKGVVHYGTAGTPNPDFQIGDVTIPKYWAHIGLWNWQRYEDGPDDELGLESNGDYTREIGYLDFSEYTNIKDVPKFGLNFLNRVWFQPEEVFLINGVPEVRQHAFWVPVDEEYYNLSEKFEGMELNRCINSSTCLPREPRVVRVDRGCSGNTFVSNAAYKEFIRSKFNVTTVDMESAAVLLVCFEQGIPFIAVRAVSGGGSFQLAPSNAALFTALATQNAVIVATRFISMLHKSRNASIYKL